jgi:hypothetical protein
MRLFFFDAACLQEQSEVSLVPPPLEKLGPLLRGGSPSDKDGVSSAMGSFIMPLDSGGYRLYYTGIRRTPPGQSVCVADSSDGVRWTKPKLGLRQIDGEKTNALFIEGLPPDSSAGQPSMVRLSDGRWRMYVWIGRSKPRILRYVAAESTDGLHWKAVNVDSPCLWHPLELSPMESWSWLDGPESRKAWDQSQHTAGDSFTALKGLRSNDAVHTYTNPAGGYEMFAVWALPNRPGSGRRVEADNARAMLRVLHRRTSEDGLRWSDPELILVPDGNDAWDQQFYYLAQHRMPVADRMDALRIGFLGRYRVIDQDMDIEFVYSKDGREWHRPMRGAWLPRGPEGSLDSTRIYMPSHLIDRGDHWLGLYSAANVKHNMAREGGENTVHGVKIPRYRFAGLGSTSSLSARLWTKPFILPSPHLAIDAAIQGSLRAELCNAFGQPLEGCTYAESIPISGDSPRHALRWKQADYGDYQFDAVSLRLEWTGGVVYGAFGI